MLASGSSGNCIYLEQGRTKLLIDAGLSGRETARRLGQIGVALGDVGALCLTHEHGDHVLGLGVLHQRHNLRLFANLGTIEALRCDVRRARYQWNVFSTGAPFLLDDLNIEPFAVSHDAGEPVGFVVTGGGRRVGVVTDIGMPTHLVREKLRGCHVVVLEANHDEQMLTTARRPWHLKQRVRGRLGHLSNRHAAEMLAEIAGETLQQVFLAHISADCNTPDLALDTVRRMLAERGAGHVCVEPTYSDRISKVWAPVE
ncbi:MAG: MBL fold metallo-hydrolase [Kiritimatiellia bacterium]|nr:MBL fold metallo-hydrolase [Lentisphaerota bacterium]